MRSISLPACLLALVVSVADASSSSAIRDAEAKPAAVTGQVAYVRVRAGQCCDGTWISVAELGGGGRREITRRPGANASLSDSGPAWSPDGSRLAFIRSRGGRHAPGLFVANRDGSGLREILRLSVDPLSGYPDDDQLAFSWSPDGQRIAVANGPLYVVNRDGRNARKLLASSACKPSWSPDGRSLLFLEDRGCGGRGDMNEVPGHKAVYRIDADGSRRRLLARGSFGDASWSPNGRQIAVTDRCQVSHGSDWDCSVSLMRADGSGRRRFTQAFSFPGGWVEWAAGGNQVLSGLYGNILATNVATGKTHKVLRPPYEGDLTLRRVLAGVSADGQRIAVFRWESKGFKSALFIMSVSGRLLQRVTVPPNWHFIDESVYLP